MEQLILVLFVLFSLFSALMERRKRKQRAQQKTAPQQSQSRQQQREVEEEEEEETGGWPFPMDPFDLEPKKPRRVQVERSEEVEQEARAAEQRALEMQQKAQELEHQAREVQPRQRVDKLVRERVAREQEEQGRAGEKRRKRSWKLDPEKARQAVVYSEILGLPKSERREEEV